MFLCFNNVNMYTKKEGILLSDAARGKFNLPDLYVPFFLASEILFEDNVYHFLGSAEL